MVLVAAEKVVGYETLIQSFYSKSMNKWWDGYNHEEVVVLDDYDLSIRVSSLLSEDMGRPLFVQCGSKGGMMRIRPKTIIVTSQYSLDACFPEKETLNCYLKKISSTSNRTL